MSFYFYALLYKKYVVAHNNWYCYNETQSYYKSIKCSHYSDIILGTMASQITRLKIVCWTVYSGADQRKHQCSAPPAFVWGIHWWPVNSPHKGPVTRKMFPFDDVILYSGQRSHYTISITTSTNFSLLHVFSYFLEELFFPVNGMIWISPYI